MTISNLKYNFTFGEWLGWRFFRMLEKAIDPWRDCEPKWFRHSTFRPRLAMFRKFSSLCGSFIARGVHRIEKESEK